MQRATNSALKMDAPTIEELRVVVADDNDAQRESVCRLLRAEAGFLVDDVSTREVLMSLLTGGDIDCIVLDTTLGSESAFAIHDLIKAKYPDPPAVIILSSAGTELAAIKAFRGGFSDYVRRKELNPRELISAVSRAVARSRAEKSRRAEFDHLASLALLDRVTGLPNRGFLEDRISAVIASRRRRRKPFAVLSVQMNELRGINDRFGHVVGDRALKVFAERLRTISRASDTYGRFSGDVFLYLIDHEVSAETIDRACRRLAEELSFSADFDNVGLSLSSSVGAAIYPFDGDTTAELLERAEQDMIIAKSSGGGYRPGLTPLPGPGQSRKARRPASPGEAVVLPPGSALSVKLAGASEPGDGEALAVRSVAAPAEGPAAEFVAAGLEAIHRDENRRTETRQRVLKRGIIIVNDGFSTVSCVVRDLSPHGARVTVEAEYLTPTRFLLMLAESGERFSAEQRWHRGRDIGLKLSKQETE